MSISTEAIIALVALFVACVPGIRFLIKHRRKLAQRSTTPQYHRQSDTPNNGPIEDVPYVPIYGGDSTPQHHPNAHGSLSSEPLYHRIFPQLLHRTFEACHIFHTAVLYNYRAGEEEAIPLSHENARPSLQNRQENVEDFV